MDLYASLDQGGGHTGPAGDHGKPGSAKYRRGGPVVLLGHTVNAHQAGWPVPAERGKGREGGHARVVTVHDVGVPTPHCPAQVEGASNQTPRSSLDEGKGELRDVAFGSQGPWRRSDGRYVSSVDRTLAQGEGDPLSAADAELLNHVQYSHQPS
jgi:hypothetical protein